MKDWINLTVSSIAAIAACICVWQNLTVSHVAVEQVLMLKRNCAGLLSKAVDLAHKSKNIEPKSGNELIKYAREWHDVSLAIDDLNAIASLTAPTYSALLEAIKDASISTSLWEARAAGWLTISGDSDAIEKQKSFMIASNLERLQKDQTICSQDIR